MMRSAPPRHIGFVVDGNRRWAKERGLPVQEGHEAGYVQLKEVLIELLRRGTGYVSAFVFSTENWRRSKVELDMLMKLFVRVLTSDVPEFVENNVRVRVIGSREQLSRRLVKAIENVEEKTNGLTGGTLLLCLNYGGHLEIAEACKKIMQSGATPADVTPELIAANLYEPDVPPCDLVVRTSGEQRLSNFMLWRAAYSELMFIDKMWPDMTKSDVDDILVGYTRRSRRFGG